MLIDALNLFSEDQNITAAAVSTNVLDLGAKRNIGIGEPMSAVIMLKGDAAAACTVELQTSATDDFASSEVVASGIIPVTAKAGDKLVIGVPASESLEQFIRLDYKDALGAIVLSALMMNSMIQNDTVYASGVTIS